MAAKLSLIMTETGRLPELFQSFRNALYDYISKRLAWGVT